MRAGTPQPLLPLVPSTPTGLEAQRHHSFNPGRLRAAQHHLKHTQLLFYLSIMSRTEGTPVDEANMVVSQRNGLNIQELESEITASGKVTAEDLELLAVLKRADSDKNGVVSAHEAMAIFRDDAKVRPRVLVHCMTRLPLSPSDPSVVAITLLHDRLMTALLCSPVYSRTSTSRSRAAWCPSSSCCCSSCSSA